MTWSGLAGRIPSEVNPGGGLRRTKPHQRTIVRLVGLCQARIQMATAAGSADLRRGLHFNLRVRHATVEHVDDARQVQHHDAVPFQPALSVKDRVGRLRP